MYVIPDKNGHKHESEILTTQSLSYSYSADTRVLQVPERASILPKTMGVRVANLN